MFFCAAMNARSSLPSWVKALLEWLSFLLVRSGPTSGVGLISTRNVASDSSTVRLNHSFCSVPQIVFSGPSGILFGAAEVAALDQPDLQVLAPADRAIGSLAHGHLLGEDRQPCGEGEAAHLRFFIVGQQSFCQVSWSSLMK